MAKTAPGPVEAVQAQVGAEKVGVLRRHQVVHLDPPRLQPGEVALVDADPAAGRLADIENPHYPVFPKP